MSINAERLLLEAFLAHQEIIPLVEVNENWFTFKEYKEIAAALISSEGKFDSILEIESSVKSKNPLTAVTYEKLSTLRLNGTQVKSDDINHFHKIALSLKKEHFDEQIRRASENYASIPSDENKEMLEYLFEQNDQFHKEEDDGSIKEALDEVLNGFFEEEPAGILSYPMVDKQLNGGFENNTLTIIGARPSVGKAHPNYTKIPTPNGYKEIGNLKVGDCVFDRYGKPTKVTGVYPRGEMETYKVTLNDGRSTFTAADHIWSHFSMGGDRKERLINKTTQEMYEAGTHLKKNKPSGKFGYHAKYSIPTNGAVEFIKKEHVIDPYVIGALIGDGCLLERGLTISSDDLYVVEKVADLLNVIPHKSSKNNFSWNFKLKVAIKNKKRLQTKDVLSDFPELTTYSYLKSIPEEYLFTDKADRMRLLNGLFDTDGHATNSSNKMGVGYTTTSKKLMEQIRWLLQSCGYMSSLILDKREGRRDCYNIGVLAQPEQLKELFTLDVKKNVVLSNMTKRTRKYDRIAIKSIKKTGKLEEVTCISVDNEEQLYLCNDFIVTHNTAFSLNLIFEMLSKNEDIVVDFFSLEMSKKQVMRRFASMMSDINGYRLKNALKQCTEEEYDRFMTTYSYLSQANIRVYNDSQIDTIIKKIKKRHHEADGKPHIAFIDHISITNVNNERKNDRERVSEITRKLKNVTNDLDMPIVALSQLNRAVESRQDTKPTMSDLRDSGSAEQDASNIIFLSRPIIEDGYGNTMEDRNSLVATFAKVRDGETGDIEFNYFRDIQRILNKEVR